RDLHSFPTRRSSDLSLKTGRKNFALGSPANDFLGFPRHFLSPKFRPFSGKRSFSTATPDCNIWRLSQWIRCVLQMGAAENNASVQGDFPRPDRPLLRLLHHSGRSARHM